MYDDAETKRVKAQEDLNANDQHRLALRLERMRRGTLEEFPEYAQQTTQHELASVLEAGFEITSSQLKEAMEKLPFFHKGWMRALIYAGRQYKSKETAQKAVKAVATKPRLVRQKSARNGRSPQQQAQSNALANHMKSRTRESAIAALDKLIP
jgi:hypothetical protein